MGLLALKVGAFGQQLCLPLRKSGTGCNMLRVNNKSPWDTHTHTYIHAHTNKHTVRMNGHNIWFYKYSQNGHDYL
jgi:hypothetical protein